MKWSDHVGHTLQGPTEGHTFVVVEYDPRAGLWIENLTRIGDPHRLRCISERAVDRTFHHDHDRCAKCRANNFAYWAKDGTKARDVYDRKYAPRQIKIKGEAERCRECGWPLTTCECEKTETG